MLRSVMAVASVKRVSGWRSDWSGQKYLFFGGLLLLISAILTVFYYINYPRLELNLDTPGYLDAVHQLQMYFNPVHPWRLPVYPLFILVVYALAGQGNLMAVSIAQGGLFVLSTLEFYVLVALIVRRGWLAFLAGIFVGTNLILLSYSKPIMSEGLTLWLLTTLALWLILFIRSFALWLFWLITAWLCLLFFTRPEWSLLPVLIYAYLLLMAFWRGRGRELLWRSLLALLILYMLLGGYIAVNAWHNGFVGLSRIEPMNLLGKVLQYNMQNEAPARYHYISLVLDHYTVRGQRSPYYILGKEAWLARDNAKLVSDFSRTIILQHPIEFIFKTLPYCLSSLITYHASLRAPIPGPYDGSLNWLLSLHQALYALNILFPACALFWPLCLLWRRARARLAVQQIALLALIGLYALVITTFGGYFDHDYMRVHVTFAPLVTLTIGATLWLALSWLAGWIRPKGRRET